MCRIDTYQMKSTITRSILDFIDTCPPQFNYVPGTSNCYLTNSNQEYTWQQADAECKSRDGSLVAMETRDEYDAVKDWFKRSMYL